MLFNVFSLIFMLMAVASALFSTQASIVTSLLAILFALYSIIDKMEKAVKK